MHGLLTGFLFPLFPWFFFKELPLPNFFDHTEPDPVDDLPIEAAAESAIGDAPPADSAATPAETTVPSTATQSAAAQETIAIQRQALLNLANEPIVQGVVFGKRMQVSH